MIVDDVTRNVGVASAPSTFSPRCPLVMELLDSVTARPVAVPMCTAGCVAEADERTVPDRSCRLMPALAVAGNARQLPLVVAAIVDALLLTVMLVASPTKERDGPATLQLQELNAVVRDTDVPPT